MIFISNGSGTVSLKFLGENVNRVKDKRYIERYK